MDKLKKCPFCGGEAELLQGVTEIHNYVMCMHCYCKTQYYNTQKIAIQTWNTRKPVEDVVEALKKRIDHHISLVNYEMNLGTIVDVEKHKKAIGVLDKAIEIVKEHLT